MPYHDDDDYDDEDTTGAYHYYDYYNYNRPYSTYGPFNLVTLVMTVAMLFLCLLCVVCTLMFIADLAEEYPSRAKMLLKALIVLNLVIHTLIACVDRLSWWRSCVSIAVNLVYLRLMRTFPFVPHFVSPLMLSAIAGAIVECTAWYVYSISYLHDTPWRAIVAFFVLLWLVPVGLLISCVAESDKLPGTGAYGGNRGRGGDGDAIGGGSGGQKRTLFGRIVTFFKNPGAV